VHEHILPDFIGAAKLAPGRYQGEEAFGVIRPYLAEAAAAGLRTLVDATPEHLGRDAVLLRQLSNDTGVHIVASTGIYSARVEGYVPAYARTETAEQLAGRF
jgi:phosphotriesterase-related protein